MIAIVNEFDGKMNKLWQLFDDEDFHEIDMENDYKNLDIFLKLNLILFSLRIVKKYDLSEI